MKLMKKLSLKSLPLHLFAVLLCMDVCSLVLEKVGSASAGNAVGQELDFYWRLIHVPWAWVGVALGPLQLLVWSKILSKTDLSVAYPVSSLCFPLTMLTAALVLHEHISLSAMAGALLISCGVAIVGGDHSDSDVQVDAKVQPEPVTVSAGAEQSGP